MWYICTSWSSALEVEQINITIIFLRKLTSTYLPPFRNSPSPLGLRFWLNAVNLPLKSSIVWHRLRHVKSNFRFSLAKFASQETVLVLTMLSIRLTQVFFLLAFTHLTASLPVRYNPTPRSELKIFVVVTFMNMCFFILSALRDEDEMESFLPEIRHSNAPWSLSGINSADALLEARLR